MEDVLSVCACVSRCVGTDTYVPVGTEMCPCACVCPHVCEVFVQLCAPVCARECVFLQCVRACMSSLFAPICVRCVCIYVRRCVCMIVCVCTVCACKCGEDVFNMCARMCVKCLFICVRLCRSVCVCAVCGCACMYSVFAPMCVNSVCICVRRCVRIIVCVCSVCARKSGEGVLIMCACVWPHTCMCMLVLVGVAYRESVCVQCVGACM